MTITQGLELYWNGKSRLTIILLADYLQENQKTKILKNIMGAFGQNTRKNEISANITLSVLTC